MKVQKKDENPILLSYANGGCGCLMLLIAIVYFPLGLLLVTGVLKEVPAFIRGQDIPGVDLPMWGYLANGLISALWFGGAYLVSVRKWWGFIILYLATGAFIGIDVSLGAPLLNRLILLVWPTLLVILYWAPWRKGFETAARMEEQRGNNRIPLRDIRQKPQRSQQRGTITTIRAEDLLPYQQPAGVAQAIERIEQMRIRGDILGLLNAKVNSVRWEDNDAALKALDTFESTAILPELVEAFNVNDEGVREAAAGLLGRTHDARAFQPLLEALNDPSGKVRGGSAYHLGGFGDRRAVKALLDCLSDPDPYVRMGAAKSLGELGDLRAVDPLIAALDDIDHFALFAAVVALGDLGDPRARRPLQDVLPRASGDTSLYSVIINALGKLDRD